MSGKPKKGWARRMVLAEIALVFAVFFLQGADPVPDVNEPCYLGKAIHYWNPDWVPGDFFLNSKDTHKVFYFTFGWLALWLAPPVLAWVGRLLTWVLLAWAWRRLSFAVVPRPWFSVLSAALLLCLLKQCHMAGEWVVGGVEAKGFAFVLVFLGLEALARGRWNRMWLLLGAASAFHVLVGGWSVVAAALVWFGLRTDRPPLGSMWPAVLGGFVLSLPGLYPSLALNWGVDGETVRQANLIYVYERLPHHLVPWALPPRFVLRFGLLFVFWLVLCMAQSAEARSRRLQAFVTAAVVIALAGVLINLLACFDPVLAAGWLRFYWFRLADVAVPLGVALEATSLIAGQLQSRPKAGRRWLAVAILVAGVNVGVYAARRPLPRPAPADRLRYSVDWRLACDWIAHSGRIPPDARFLTPRLAQTFKWYARHSEVVNWKEIPQDARAIVEWRRRNRDLYAANQELHGQPWHDSLAELGTQRLRQLGAKYQADYVITVSEPRLSLEIVYPENKRLNENSYVIYRLDGGKPIGFPVPDVRNGIR